MYQNMSEQWSFDGDKKCPKCGQSSIEKSYQEPIVKGKQGKDLHHCANPKCAGYHRTKSSWNEFVEHCKEL